MYGQVGHCPQCDNEIGADRVMGSTIICECGWTKSAFSDQADRRNMDKACAAIVLIGGLLIASFLQAVNWDRYFFAIIPLKTKQLIGTANAKDLEEIATICHERLKLDCVERAYFQIALKDPTNLENLARLGKLQFQRDKHEKAVATLTLYFSQKGKDLEAAYTYAQALTKLKKFDQADRYYRFALKQKPNVLQISVIRTYVRMLMEANRFQQAKETILSFRKKSPSANMFMARELDEIRSKLGEEVKTAAASSL